MSPEIQPIANLVVHDGVGHVLLARYNPSGEIEAADADVRWWLPAHELEPYQHPDDAAGAALAEIGGLTVAAIQISGVQSFRGRRGWHLSFDYLVEATGVPSAASAVPAAWFDRSDLPATMHGRWERDTIDRVLG